MYKTQNTVKRTQHMYKIQTNKLKYPIIHIKNLNTPKTFTIN